MLKKMPPLTRLEASVAWSGSSGGIIHVLNKLSIKCLKTSQHKTTSDTNINKILVQPFIKNGSRKAPSSIILTKLLKTQLFGKNNENKFLPYVYDNTTKIFKMQDFKFN